MIKKIYNGIVQNTLLLWLSTVVAVAIAFFWFYVTKRYSVNILFSDAWNFHRVFIWDYSLVQQYNFQFGPPRLGIGLIITGWINNLSGWDANWISMTIGILIFFSCLIYLIIRWKLFGKFNPFDVSVFIMILSLLQYEVVVITPFLSYAGVPALLVSLYCLTLFIKSLPYRNFILLVLNFLLVYSAFGFFMGLVTIALFSFETMLALKQGNKRGFQVSLTSLLVAVGTVIIFFAGYDKGYAGDHVLILWNKPWKYLIFVSLSYAGLFGVKGIGTVQVIFGLIIFGTVLFVFVKSLARIFNWKFQNENELPLDKILFVLTLFSLLFVVNLSFGRLRMGLEYAGSSRYLPYLVPSIIGVYFYLSSLKLSQKSILIPVFFVLMMLLQYSSIKSVGEIKAWYTMKSNWKASYLKYEDADMADSVSNFRVHPNNKSIQDVLDYLKQNQLNLYHETTLSTNSNKNNKPELF